jgi:hypothetical protein
MRHAAKPAVKTVEQITQTYGNLFEITTIKVPNIMIEKIKIYF